MYFKVSIFIYKYVLLGKEDSGSRLQIEIRNL
jgi:hypothetical protein